MAINKKIYWLLIPFFFAIGILYYTNSYTEFTPLVMTNGSYSVLRMDAALNKNLMIVLDFYHEPYKIIVPDKILVKRSLDNDKELVINYTRKALDIAWLNSHGK